LAINEQGSIVGTIYEGENHLAYPYLWTEEDGMQLLPSLGGAQTVPADINSQNQIVGWALTAKGQGVRHAFLWTPNFGIQDLGSLIKLTEEQAALLPSPGTNMVRVTTETAESVASAINDKGWVVGSSLADDGLNHPFLWKPQSGMIDLGMLPGYDEGGQASDINDEGTVLINFLKKRFISEQEAHVLGTPFIWTEKEGFIELPVPSGYEDVRAYKINNRREILLHARNALEGSLRGPVKLVGFLFSDGVLRELPAIGEADATNYASLNDKGWLIGRAVNYRYDDKGEFSGENSRGFLARPISSKE
jgi:probable HAF family extracellular repeat protein